MQVYNVTTYRYTIIMRYDLCGCEERSLALKETLLLHVTF